MAALFVCRSSDKATAVAVILSLSNIMVNEEDTDRCFIQSLFF